MSEQKSVTMLKKLGAKQIVGNVKKAVSDFCANDGDKVTIYTIFGIANGVKTGTSNYGDWVAFQGQFEAENHVDGQSYASNQAFIVEPLQSMLMRALEGSDSVQFAITVDAKRRDDLQCGYEYIVTPHIQTQEADPLAHLRSSVPKLSAPKPVAQLEAPAEDTKPAKGKTK
jgi:hypothetical protein